MTLGLQEKVEMQMDQQDIWHLLKYGRAEDVRALVEQQKKENYPNEFVPFMDQMIMEHKISRKNVAVRSGLSQDYVYKLLRGDKHTDERDYILAMCFSIGMTLAQTQHALSSYGMPRLSRGDSRSNIIILAIENGDDIDELDIMLEKAGFPLLKTSPDMPSAPIVDTLSTNEQLEVFSGVIPFKEGRREFEEIDSFIEGRHNGGNAPFDYDYQGWIKIKDGEGNIYQVEAVFKSEYSSFLVFTEDQRLQAEQIMELRNQRECEFYDKHKNVLEPTGGQIDPFSQPELYDEFIALSEDIPEAEMLEYYECIEDAAGSEFFPFFLELDKRTDKEVQNVMKKLDDTREYGVRVGASCHGEEQPKSYIEMFNDKQPELREYFQLTEYLDGTYRYTATHESCFMQLDLGQTLYEIYFGKKREPEYFIDTTKNEFTGSNARIRFIFNSMKMVLHEQMMKSGFFVGFDQESVLEDRIECFIEQGVLCHHSGDERSAISNFLEGIKVLESAGEPEKTHLSVYVCTCLKIAMSYENLDDPAALTWWQKIFDLRDAVIVAYDTDPETYESAISAVVSTEMHFYYDAWKNNDTNRAKHFVTDIIDLIENRHVCPEEWDTQFDAYGKHAVLIENENLEESLREYRKALTIARDHHLDQECSCAHAVAIQNNNYAWVLWNKCGSEEAVLYYGRAIDLLESYLFSGIVERSIVLDELKHVGAALNQIYIDTGRSNASEHLKERLLENNVSLV